MKKHSQLASLIGAFSPRASFQKYLHASYSENTKRAYQQDLQHFKKWGGKLPASPVTVAKYLAFHAGKLSHATLARRLAALHRDHLTRGLRSPIRAPLVAATLRGIKRAFPKRQRQVKPILKQHLVAFLKHMKGMRGARDRALLLLGFFGGFRRSELASLDVGHIRFTREGLIVQLERSKTDQEGEGREVLIPKLTGPLCAVGAVTRWLQVSKIADGPIFRRVTTYDTVGKRCISGGVVAGVVKLYVELIGLDPSEYSGHSLRAGLVTSAAMAGASNWQIRKQTGHKTDAIIARYIRAPQLFSSNVAKLVA